RARVLLPSMPLRSTHTKAARVYEPVAPKRFGLRQAFRHHGRDNQVGNACRGLACAKEKQLLVDKLTAVNPQCGEQASESYGGGTLDVVIEDARIIPVFVQETEGRMIGKILELAQHSGEDVTRGSNEFLDERIIGLASQPFLGEA